MPNLTREEIITQCAWCFSVLESGEWKLCARNLAETLDNVSHGACPECYQKLTGKPYTGTYGG